MIETSENLLLFQDYLRYCGDKRILLGQVRNPFMNRDLNPASILEIGCGSGRLLPNLYELLPRDGVLVGLDVAPEQIALAREHMRILNGFPESTVMLKPMEVVGLARALEYFDLSYVDWLNREHLDWLELRSVENPPYMDSKPDATHLEYQLLHVGRIQKVEAVRSGFHKVNKRFNFSGLELLVGDAKALPFPDDSFDTVVMNDVLLYFPPDKAKTVLDEAQRVAKKDLLFSTYPTCENSRSFGYHYCLSHHFVYFLLNYFHNGTPSIKRVVAEFAKLPDFDTYALPLDFQRIKDTEEGKAMLEQYEEKENFAIKSLERKLHRTIPIGTIREIVTMMYENDPKTKLNVMWRYFLEQGDAFYLYDEEDIFQMIGECGVTEEGSNTAAMFQAGRLLFHKIK